MLEINLHTILAFRLILQFLPITGRHPYLFQYALVNNSLPISLYSAARQTLSIAPLELLPIKRELPSISASVLGTICVAKNIAYSDFILSLHS